MMKKFMLRVLFTMVMITGMHLYVNAQPGDPGDPGDDPDKVPLDPGTWVLVAAGAGYGIKKWKDAKRENKTGSSDITATRLPENKNDSC